jgi:broad specificity phosphatase PhoE
VARLVTLARHGETADNARRIFQGQRGHGLSSLGRAQAVRMGERLRRSPPAAIVSSDLERAIETARIVSEICSVPFETEPGLREIDVGAWTGKSYDEVARDFPADWAAWRGSAGAPSIDVRLGGGETYRELAERMHRTIHALTSTERGEGPLLVVSHGGAIKSWAAKILGVSDIHVLGGVANTSLTVVEVGDRGGYRVQVWNDAAHLEGLRIEADQT